MWKKQKEKLTESQEKCETQLNTPMYVIVLPEGEESKRK